MRLGRYEYDDTHRCIGIIVDETLVARRPDETKEEITARIEHELDDGRDWLLVDFVAAKEGKPWALGDYLYERIVPGLRKAGLPEN